MIDWIKIAQGVAAIVAAMLATMVACLPRLVFSPEPPIRARTEVLEQFQPQHPAPGPDQAQLLPAQN
jgi:hypothetical protein